MAIKSVPFLLKVYLDSSWKPKTFTLKEEPETYLKEYVKPQTEPFRPWAKWTSRKSSFKFSHSTVLNKELSLLQDKRQPFQVKNLIHGGGDSEILRPTEKSPVQRGDGNQGQR